MKMMTMDFTPGANALLKQRANQGGKSVVEVEFGDGFQSDLVELGWSDRQANGLDEQLLARLPKGSSVDWEDRELFHIAVPKGSTQDPVADVAALLKHVRDNPVHPDAVAQKLNPGASARPATAQVQIPADFLARYPHARAEIELDGQLSLSGAGKAERSEVMALFQQLSPVAPAQPETPAFPQDGFQFGQASQQAAGAVTAAAAGPLGGMIFVFTGSLEGMTRSEAARLVQEKGAKTASDVSRKTTHVVAGENPGDKLDKARALGIPVLDQEQFGMLLHG